MSKIHELAFNAEEIDELLDSVDKKTIYQDATQSKHGLMSTTDKTKLDALPTAQQIDSALNAKVDKVEGKGLSKNDYTDEDKAKVASALQSETDPTVPSWAKQSTKPSYDYSEIGNTPDLSGFITKSVNDLTNYYLKSETYTKAEVAALIGAIQQFHYEIYSTLPQSGESNVLYLIGPTGSGSDKYEEYVYANNAFTKIGDTSIDLSGYVTTSALNTVLADYTTTANLTTLLSNKADKVSNTISGNFAGLDANGNLTDSGKKASDFATASQGAKADTAYQKPSSGIPESDLSSGVQQALQKHFKGWYASSSALPSNPVIGDYAYVKGAESTDPAAIYECITNGSWSDSGRTADTSNVQTFASGEEVNDVHIVNDLTSGGIDDVLSAEAGKELGDEIFEFVPHTQELATPDGDVGSLYYDLTDGFKTPASTASRFHIYVYNITKTGTFRVVGTSTTSLQIFVVGKISSIQDIQIGNYMDEVLSQGVIGGSDAEPQSFDFSVNVNVGDLIAVSVQTVRAKPTVTLSYIEQTSNIEGIQQDIEGIQQDIEGIQQDIEGINGITYRLTANIHNSAPATVSDTMPTDGSDWYHHNLEGVLNTGYSVSYYIPIDPTVSYKSNVSLRRVIAYNSNFIVISDSNKEIVEPNTEISYANESYVNNIAYLRILYYSWYSDNGQGSTRQRDIYQIEATPDFVKFGKYTDDIDVDYGYKDYDKFDKQILTEEDRNEIEQEISEVAENSGLVRVVNVANSDKLLVVGSSSVASNFALPLKSWTNKLNDSLDWMFLTYGISGYNCEQLANALKNGTNVGYTDGVKPSQIHPTYVFVGHYKNMSSEAGEQTSDSIIEQNRILMETCKSVFNAPLIVGSDYTNEGSYHGEMAMLQLAKELNADYYPFGAYGNNLLRNQTKPSGLWNGWHPGTKTNNFYYQEVYNIFKNLNQPKQSIKVYTPRTGVSDYTYGTPKERNEKFTSVESGNYALMNNQEYYDRINSAVLPSSSTAASTGDYYRLMKKDTVTLDIKALVEVIVPVVNAEKFEVYVESANIANIAIKVFNNNTGVYDTFTKTDVEGVDGAYITISDVKYVQFDKIKVLLDSESTITINDVYVKCYGGKEKVYKREINANSMSGKPIYRGGQGFGSDWETVWTNGGNCESYIQTAKYGADFEDLPKFLNISTNKIVVLPYDASEKKTISLTIPSTTLNDGVETMLPRLFRVEVYCRTFSKIYNPTAYAEWVGDNNPYTNTPLITSKSYDYTTLGLDVAIAQNNNKVAVFDEQVGQFWSRVLFDVWIPPFTNSDMTFTLYRKPNDFNSDFELQIADVAITRID